MKRIKRGWALTKKSWALLNGHRELIRFPLYGALVTIPLAIIFLGPGLYLLDQKSYGGAIPILVVGIYLLTVVSTYFAVGLAAAANKIFQGESNVTVSDGLGVARNRFPEICGWAALSTAIGLVMVLLENQGGALGSIAARLVGMAWALVTFMAVPVLAIEGPGPFTTLKRSATIFKEKWGQQITGNIAIGGAITLFAVLPAALLIAAGIVLWPSSGPAAVVLILIGAVIMCVALLISKALSGVFGVALYRYAVDGEAVGGFTQDELESAVKLKKGRRGDAPPTATPGTV
jgi:Family of unknown function (DUF6159)